MANTADKGVLYEQLSEVISEKKALRNPLIEVLREAQEIFGYLPREVQEYVAAQLELPISKVYGVVTFYNFFSMKPRGKYVLNVCTGTACYVKGADRLIQMLEEELDSKLGETTTDGLFTITSVRCVGACSLAPVVVVGEDTYGRIDKRKQLQEIVKFYKNEHESGAQAS